VGDVSVAAGVAALTVIGLCAWTLHGSDPADAAARAGNSGLSVFGTIHPPLLSYGSDSAEADVPRTPRVHLASLDSTFDSRFATNDNSFASSAGSSAWPSASFEDRFGSPNPSRTIRVKTVSVAPSTTGSIDLNAARATTGSIANRGPRVAAAVPLPRPAPKPATAQTGPIRYRLASLSETALPASAYAPADAATKDADAPKESNPLTDDPAHTAIYDISAHVVYMPSGERLEAHSGLGGYMDDVRAVNLRKRGPTPPNIYQLRMRESLFHGVQAIRLVPMDERKMYGRDGILAHPFMLGANGDSNGCVSFKDYPAFLKAYQRGEVTRMVVVEQLDDPPGGRTASDWISGTLKKLFGRS
jgi:Protein of unknown function (DUF2778)